MPTSERKKIKASEFDRAFERGDVTKHLDLKTAQVRYPVQRVNVDIPQEILKRLDQEASRIGVPRTSLIKLWISERLSQLVH